MSGVKFTPKSKWPYTALQFGDESNLQLQEDQSSSITELSRSPDQSSISPVSRNLQLQQQKGLDSDSEEYLRQTPSPSAGVEVRNSGLVQSPPIDGFARPKCTSSPVTSKC